MGRGHYELSPDTKRKRLRNHLVREFRRDHPELSLDEIGLLFNISKQRVWAICQQEDSLVKT